LWKYEDDKLWKMDKQTKKWKNFDNIKLGTSRYIKIGVTIDGKQKMYLLHRLVYFFHNPDWNIHNSCPDNSIDHMNGDKLDNKIENLENVTHSQNKQNITHKNKKEIKGVYFRNNGCPKPWCAYWFENKKHKSKCFATEKEALEHRKKMVEKHYYCPRKNID
jgi:hypothetical protein